MVPGQSAAKDGLFIVERTGCGVGLTPLSFLTALWDIAAWLFGFPLANL